MKNVLILISVVNLFFLSNFVNAAMLVTDNFEITITLNCSEGEVTCNDVNYHGKNKRDGSSIHLAGRTLHSLCADGITPCSFQGYLFKSGNIDYIVHAEGILEVVQNSSKTLVKEKGNWKY